MKVIGWALLLALPAFGQDLVWRWVDDSGEEHYTNDKSSIPEKARARATSTEGAELSVLSTSDSSSPAPIGRPVQVAPAVLGRPIPGQVVSPAPKATPIAPLRGTLRLVLFEASTNSASKTLRRSGVVEKLVLDNPGLKLERLEFATAVERAEQLHVTEIPTVLFLDEAGVERGRTSGLTTLKQLQAQLDQAKVAR